MEEKINTLIAKTPLDQKFAALLVDEVEALGFVLVRVRFTGGDHPILQVMADRPEGGIDVDDCARISTALSAVLDVADPLEEAYNLEISSPGLDRPLTRIEDFSEWAGYEVKIMLAQPIEAQKRFRGMLVGVEADEILLETEHGVLGIRFDWLAEAKLVLSDEIIKESLRRGSAANLDESKYDEIDETSKKESDDDDNKRKSS